MAILSRVVVLRNRDGLHARPISQIVEIANRHTADLKVEVAGLEVSGRSILQLMTLGAPKGAQLVFTAEGPDASELLEALSQLVEQGFGEPME
ncbi:MAG: HPr family phosphocarrier protein [Planctomycetota bacterium]